MKDLIKKIINCLCFFLISPALLIYFLLSLFSCRDSLFWAFSQAFSLWPGKIGCYLRKNFYYITMSYCSLNCTISFCSIFSQRDTEIGSGVYIGPQSNVGSCRIENDCVIGSGVHIVSGSRQHNFDDLDIPIREQGGTLEKIIVGEDSWIGNGVIIMANIGKKCIVGAGSVVTRDVEDFSIVAGNPAKLIKKRQ